MTGWILLLAAIGIGALAFFLVRGYLSSQEEQIRLDLLNQQGKSGRVVVASKNLLPGALLSGANLAVGELPVEHLSSRAVRPGDFERVKGRVLTRPMNSGEPLLTDYVAGLLVERFSDLLSKGERAVSLEVAALETHAGMLLPGDYVDLFVLLAPRGVIDRRLAPVLERVKVLAAGPQPLRTADQTFQPLPEREKRYSQITVGVPLAEAERLVLAREAGDIVYMLRNAKDTGGISGLSNLFADDPLAEGYLYISARQPQGTRRALNNSPDTAPGEAGAVPRFAGEERAAPAQDQTTVLENANAAP